MRTNRRSHTASKRSARTRTAAVVLGVIAAVALTVAAPAAAAAAPGAAAGARESLGPASAPRPVIQYQATPEDLAGVAEAATRQGEALYAVEQAQQQRLAADTAAFLDSLAATLDYLAAAPTAPVLDAAASALGRPYVYGASGPGAFDCSGFTRWAWQAAGIELPHYSGAQWAQTEPIPLDQLQPGDLVFYWGRGDGDPSHVGLYVGDGQMIHAPGRGRSVRYESIDYWSGARMAAGRVA